MQRDRHPQRLQPLDDVVTGGLFLGSAGLTNEGGEAIEQRAGFIETDSTVRRGFERLVLEHVTSGHGVLQSFDPPYRQSVFGSFRSVSFVW